MMSTLNMNSTTDQPLNIMCDTEESMMKLYPALKESYSCSYSKNKQIIEIK